ncbi:MAG: hypothetical protein ABIO04_13445 [Ferruginibacter sp.]
MFGIVYTNVIQVHLNGTMNVPEKGKIVFADADNLYAPNIRLIESINYDAGSG